MSPELDKQFVKDFPNLFKDRHGNPRDTCLCFGIEFEKGWANLLRELCVKITEIDKEVYFVQLKEKFGQLRAYTSGVSSENYDKIHDLIREAENKSSTICEDCGKPGELRNDLGWIRTLCQDHYKEACKKLKK